MRSRTRSRRSAAIVSADPSRATRAIVSAPLPKRSLPKTRLIAYPYSAPETGSLWKVITSRTCSPTGMPTDAAPVGRSSPLVERLDRELQLVSGSFERCRTRQAARRGPHVRAPGEDPRPCRRRATSWRCRLPKVERYGHERHVVGRVGFGAAMVVVVAPLASESDVPERFRGRRLEQRREFVRRETSRAAERSARARTTPVRRCP